jgi:pentalenene oxygenase
MTAVQAPGALPVLGHAMKLLRDPMSFLRSLPSHGDVVRIKIGPTRAIMVCDPDLTREVLVNDRAFDKGGPLIERIDEAVGHSLASCPHAEHRHLRRLIQPAFHHSRFPRYAELITAEVARALGSWQAGAVLDMLPEIQAITARVAVVTMFAAALPQPTLDALLEDNATLTAGIYRRMLTPAPFDRLPTPGKRRYDRARSRLRRILGQIIADYRAGGVDHGDLLSMLLAAGAPDPGQPDSGLSDEQVSNEVLSFFIGGMEPTANLLAWSVHLLATHPDVQRRLQAEVDSVVTGTTAAYDDLPRLELTQRILTETLRLYPGGWLVTRTATGDERIGRHRVPAGTTVAYSPYLLHHRPDLYPDPERFDPDRWTDPPASRGAYVPFGLGARKCIGDTFGLTEAALALATIAARWHLEPAGDAPVGTEVNFVLRPRGLKIRVTARVTRHAARAPGGTPGAAPGQAPGGALCSG